MAKIVDLRYGRMPFESGTTKKEKEEEFDDGFGIFPPKLRSMNQVWLKKRNGEETGGRNNSPRKKEEINGKSPRQSPRGQKQENKEENVKLKGEERGGREGREQEEKGEKETHKRDKKGKEEVKINERNGENREEERKNGKEEEERIDGHRSRSPAKKEEMAEEKPKIVEEKVSERMQNVLDAFIHDMISYALIESLSKFEVMIFFFIFSFFLYIPSYLLQHSIST